jgi:hypothetical protein
VHLQKYILLGALLSQMVLAKDVWIKPRFTVLSGFGVSYGAVYPQTTPGTARIGLSLGGQIEQPVGQDLFINFGVQYSERGVRPTLFQVMGTDVSGLIRLDNIDFLLSVKYKILNRKVGFNPFVEFGTFGSIALNRNILIADVVELGLSDRFSMIDFGLQGSLGFFYELPQGWSIIGQARYLFGLIDIDSSSAGFYTRGFQFLFGAQFSF